MIDVILSAVNPRFSSVDILKDEERGGMGRGAGVR
jgi:hypothetical protein